MGGKDFVLPVQCSQGHYSGPEANCHYLSSKNLKIINDLISNPSKQHF